MINVVSDEENIAVKCENLMNLVIESRKTFGKMSIEYDQKCSIMESKILNLKIKTIANCRFKSKISLPDNNTEDLKDIEDFTTAILERQKRIENLKVKLKNTQLMVLQLKNNDIYRKLKEPLTAEVILAKVK